MKNTIKVGITLGDANGVGPEIIIKTFLETKSIRDTIFIVYSPVDVIQYYLKNLNLTLDLNIIDAVSNAECGKFNIISIDYERFQLSPGFPSKNTGELAYRSIAEASKDILNNSINCIVTAPIDKNTIQSNSFSFQGHTEFFTNIASKKQSLMLMVKEKLRIGIVTNHIAVKGISEALTEKKIISKINLLNETLKSDFTINNPRIALLALNPHAGDKGLIGNEEINLINPIINSLDNVNISGPFPADGFFASGKHHLYDGILGMYHDQGLIPFKILSQNQGINFTAGLPFVRTSPDHGTAYEIAGKNKANHQSFKNAIDLAKEIYLARVT